MSEKKYIVWARDRALQQISENPQMLANCLRMLDDISKALLSSKLNSSAHFNILRWPHDGGKALLLSK